MKSEYLDLFDEYFADTLEEQQRLSLEKQLSKDPGFKQAFDEYQGLREGIDYSIMKTLKEELQALEATLPEVQMEPGSKNNLEKTSGIQRYVLLKVAAVVMLVAVSAVVLFKLEQPSSPQDLFTQHFTPYENDFVFAKRGDDIAANSLVQSFQAYDNQNYASAIEGFNQILAREENIMVLFYLGSAQLAQNESQAAIVTFERFLEVSEEYTIEATWYLALSYLKENRIEEAREFLNEIKGDEAFEKKATRVLKNLPK